MGKAQIFRDEDRQVSVEEGHVSMDYRQVLVEDRLVSDKVSHDSLEQTLNLWRLETQLGMDLCLIVQDNERSDSRGLRFAS